MRITYVCRSFLDYRVPVFKELNKLTNGNLTVIFNAEAVPERAAIKIKKTIGKNAIGLKGEKAFGFQGNITSEMANSSLRIPWQPGILKKIKKSKPDVLIGDGFSQWTLPCIAIRLVKRIPVVVCYERTAHTERNAQWYRKVFRKSLILLINAVCVNGILSKKYTISMGVSPKKITLGHMAADVEDLQRSVMSVSENRTKEIKCKYKLNGIIFLYVGALIPRKGISQLLKAWHVFSSEENENKMTLMLIGDGPEKKEMEKYCTVNDINNVQFTGAVDYDSIAPFFKTVDIFIMPTLEDNWSLVVPEAMSCGLPILCSKYNGCWPELVTPENGWVFDPLDINSTVSALKDCLSKKNTFKKMGSESLKIIQNHTPKHAAKSIFQACKIAVKGKA